ncbi:hypothetical protein RDI58_022863 [Solanum bulbocastanum]|uniref:Uncharacterized protein n=1 Tax=Solanum bulbocastanum TaxID=147425 RepID=A0AAN8T6I3_SOLBU
MLNFFLNNNYIYFLFCQKNNVIFYGNIWQQKCSLFIWRESKFILFVFFFFL